MLVVSVVTACHSRAVDCADGALPGSSHGTVHTVAFSLDLAAVAAVAQVGVVSGDSQPL